MGAAYQRGFAMGIRQYIFEEQAKNLKLQGDVANKIIKLEEARKAVLTPLKADQEKREDLDNQIAEQKEKLKKLKANYQKLENVIIEIVVDIEPQNSLRADPNAVNHYYILSDESEYNIFEDITLDIQPVTGATDASTNSNGEPVSTGHHSSFLSLEDLPDL